MGYDYHLDAVQKELDGAERAFAGLERQMDRLEQENQTLRAKLAEAELEIVRLKGANAQAPQFNDPYGVPWGGPS